MSISHIALIVNMVQKKEMLTKKKYKLRNKKKKKERLTKKKYVQRKK